MGLLVITVNPCFYSVFPALRMFSSAGTEL
jgi:hypothetical protein